MIGRFIIIKKDNIRNLVPRLYDDVDWELSFYWSVRKTCCLRSVSLFVNTKSVNILGQNGQSLRVMIKPPRWSTSHTLFPWTRASCFCDASCSHNHSWRATIDNHRGRRLHRWWEIPEQFVRTPDTFTSSLRYLEDIVSNRATSRSFSPLDPFRAFNVAFQIQSVSNSYVGHKSKPAFLVVPPQVTCCSKTKTPTPIHHDFDFELFLFGTSEQECFRKPILTDRWGLAWFRIINCITLFILSGGSL